MSRLTADQGQRGRDRIRVRAEEERRNVPRGHVEAALAERDAGQPLVTESLAQRLERLVPGAEVDWVASRNEWSVWRDGRCIGEGHSEREAVEKAIALWGRR
jgi:hypothetical protein